MKAEITSAGVPKLIERIAEDLSLGLKPLLDILPKFPIQGHLISPDPNKARGADIEVTITP